MTSIVSDRIFADLAAVVHQTSFSNLRSLNINIWV